MYTPIANATHPIDSIWTKALKDGKGQPDRTEGEKRLSTVRRKLVERILEKNKTDFFV